MKIDRLLSITILLLNKERISAKELAEKFEVSVRTIYRDIESLSMAGIPVIAFPGKDGGYGILENYKIDKQLLSLTDMAHILTSLKGLNLTLQDNAIEGAIEKIHNIVPKEEKRNMESLQDQLVFDIHPWGAPKDWTTRFQRIQKAITNHQLMNVVYRDTEGNQSERTIEPMSLVFKSYSWYLFGYCLIRKDYRLFKLTRLVSATTLPQGFHRRPERYQNLFKEKKEGKIPPIKLILLFSGPGAVRAKEFFAGAIQEEKDSKLLVTVAFPEGEWIYQTLLSYGPDVEVLEPVFLREEMRKRIQQMNKIYS